MASRSGHDPAQEEPTQPDVFPSGFDYELPPELIAQHPSEARDGARLMVLDRTAGTIAAHAMIRELPRWLAPGDLLVVNRSRVIPARLRAQRAGGGAAEILLIAPLPTEGHVDEPPLAGRLWRALVKPARRLRAGQRVRLIAPRTTPISDAPAHLEVEIVAIADGHAEVRLPAEVATLDLLARMGEPPLPPYIRRADGATRDDWERYQTVFASEPGSIAAPTAGLHLTERLLAELRAAGVEIAELVLHVGPATFLAGRPGRAPLAVEPERYEVPEETRARIAATRGRGRVIAVGTTTTRALESAARAGWPAGMQETSLVLSPGTQFATIDGLLTNLHLPGSSLLALVSGFAGSDLAGRAYAAAVAERYRFYSYGDAMLVL